MTGSRRLWHKSLYGAIFFLFIYALSVKSVAQSVSERTYRLRFNKLNWKTFRVPALQVYFPEGADSLASFVIREWPEVLHKVQRSNLVFSGEPQLILYPSVVALYQSNIGSTQPSLTIPTFIRKGTRLLIPFDGSYSKLREQLYEAAYRGAWRENFPSKTVDYFQKNDIPEWYQEGIIAWFANGWQPHHEDAFRDAWQLYQPSDWSSIEVLQPRLSGLAFNYFLSQTITHTTPQSVLAAVRSKQSFQRGQRMVLKRPLDTTLGQCFQFYQRRFNQTDSTAEKIDVSPVLTTLLPKGTLSSWTFRPEDNVLATVIQTTEARQVWIHPLGKKNTLLEQYRTPPWVSSQDRDPYPLLSWEGRALWIVTPYNKGFRFTRWDVESKKYALRFVVHNIDGIRQFAALGNDRFLLAAYRKGQSDLIICDARKQRFTTVTNDADDNLNFTLPIGISPETVFFQSNRRKTEDSGKHAWKGIYALSGKQIVSLVSDTAAWANWTHPQAISSTQLVASGTRTGTRQWYLIKNKNTIRLSAHSDLQVLSNQNQIAWIVPSRDSVKLYTEATSDWIQKHSAQSSDSMSPWLLDHQKTQALQHAEDSLLHAARDTNQSILSGLFQAPNKYKESLNRSQRSTTYQPGKASPYFLQLHNTYFTARVTNNYYINRYQPYRTYLGSFKFPEVGLQTQVGYADLFEDYRLTISYRLPSTTQGSDFFVRYQNERKRTGWGLTYFRKVETLRPSDMSAWKAPDGMPYPAAVKVKTHYYEGTLEHPLTYDIALHGSVALRTDQTIFLATNPYSLNFESLNSLWSIVSISGTLDKRQILRDGFARGSKLAVLTDGFKGFGVDRSIACGIQIKGEEHLHLYRGVGLSAGLQAGFSAGPTRIRYNLGGVDGAVNPRIDDSSNRASQDAPYAFQTLITPLRAYSQNSLVGDQYTLLNADFIVAPLTLFQKKTSFASLNNLKVGLWVDQATAMESWIPNSKRSTAWSFGWSLQTVLAGYRLQVSSGWPGVFIQHPVWYLSLMAL